MNKIKIENIPFPIIRGISMLLGAVYLVSGITKAADINAFADTIIQYGKPSLRMFAPIIVGIEIILGFSFITWQKTKVTARISFGLLIFFTLVFVYGYFVHNIYDCGCFGSIIKLSPIASIIRNIIMISLSGLIWRYLNLTQRRYAYSKLYLGVIYGLGFVSFFSTGFEMKNTYIVVQNIESLPLNKTSIGRSFTLPKVEKCLILIYSPQCPHCQSATPTINTYQKRGVVDTTIAITASELKIADISTFYKLYKPTFATFQVPKDSLKRVTKSIPTLIYVENGIVKKVITEGVMTAEKLSESIKKH